MGAERVLLRSLAIIALVHLASANIIQECLSLIYCNGETPICSFNSTHCWRADSDCERAKFNCLHLYKEDFDKVDSNYCDGFIVGKIKPCCVCKICPNKVEVMCGQTKTKTLNTCKWFRNRCEMENYSCKSGKDFLETHKSLCKFSFNSDEQFCFGSSQTKFNEDLNEETNAI